MATVMTSPRRPSLPTPNTPAHVRIGFQGHSQASDTAPPLPSRDHPLRRKAFETNSFVDRNTAKAYSDPQRAAHIGRTQSESNHHSNAHQQSHAHAHSAQQSRQRQPKAAADDPLPPPPPSSRPPTRPPPQYETSPPPPPVERLPVRKQLSQRETNATGQRSAHTLPRQRSTQDVPPELPPARPPKTSVSSNSSIDSGHAPVPSRPPKGQLRSAHSFEDFENRFRFHDPADFPEPETSQITDSRVYPSLQAKRKSRKYHDDSLGAL